MKSFNKLNDNKNDKIVTKTINYLRSNETMISLIVKH